MESCTGGNFTRLVFQVTGYADLCQRYGAEPVYLDEGPTVEVDLHDGTRVRISCRLHDEIVNRRERPSTSFAHASRSPAERTGQAFYLSLSKLKTHSMATMTLGVKNEQAFPVGAGRMKNHFLDLLRFFRSDRDLPLPA